MENRKKLEIKKTGVLRSIGKQSGESAESVPKKKKRKVTVGRIYRKGRFSAWKERMRGGGMLIIISINVSSITTV